MTEGELDQLADSQPYLKTSLKLYFLKKRETTFGGPHWRNHPKKLMFGGFVGKLPHNFRTGRSSQVTTQLFYNCKKVNCLAFVSLGTHQGFAAVNAAELTHMPRHRMTTGKKKRPLPQPTLSKISKLVCIHYETFF